MIKFSLNIPTVHLVTHRKGQQVNCFLKLERLVNFTSTMFLYFWTTTLFLSPKNHWNSGWHMYWLRANFILTNRRPSCSGSSDRLWFLKSALKIVRRRRHIQNNHFPRNFSGIFQVTRRPSWQRKTRCAEGEIDF